MHITDIGKINPVKQTNNKKIYQFDGSHWVSKSKRIACNMCIIVKSKCLIAGKLQLHRVSKKQAKLLSSKLRQISTNFDNFWHKQNG